MLFSPATPIDVMREAWMEQVEAGPRVLYTDLTLPTDEPDPDTETHEAQHRPVPWDMAQAERAIKFAKGNPDVLRRAWSDAHASGAPSEVLAHITKAAQPTAPLEGEIVE